MAEPTGLFGRIANGVAYGMSYVYEGARNGTAQAVGRIVVPMYLRHTTTPEEAKKFRVMQSACGDVIHSISQDLTNKIVADSNVLKGGQSSIQEAIEHLLAHICDVFISKGVENPEDLTPDQAADHFVAMIIKMGKKEFLKEGIDTKQHFKNLTEKLLRKAFPDGIHDTKIPEYIRSLLQGKKPANSEQVISYAKETIGVEDVTWETLSNTLAEKLESIYTALTRKSDVLVTEETTPGLDKLVHDIVTYIDTTAKENTKAPVANEFLSNVFVRLLKGDFTYAEDKDELDGARTWLLNSIGSSIRTIYTHIFPEGTNVEFIEHITHEAVRVFPELRNNLQTVEADEEVTKHTLAVQAIKQIIQQKIKQEELQALLPSIIPPEWLLDQFYSWLAPYVIEVVEQLDTITHDGKEAEKALAPRNNNEFAKWIDIALKYARGLLEENSLDLTSYPFINELICHAVKSKANPQAKKYVDKVLRALIHIITQAALQDKDSAPEKAIAELVEDIAQSVSQTVTELATALDKEAHAKEASEEMMERILSKELFNSLLPPFLRTSNLRESVVDLLASHIMGIYTQTERLTTLDQAEEHKVHLPELKEIVKFLTYKILGFLQPSEEEATALDRLKNHLKRSEQLQELAKTILPNILEAILAYHVNPKDGLSSEKRAARLSMRFVTIMQTSFNKIESYNNAANKNDWLEENGYTKEHFKEFRKAHNMRPNAKVDMTDFLLHEAALSVMQSLVPKELRDKIIPKEFAFFNIESRLTNLAYTYIKDAYDYSHSMKQLNLQEHRSHTEALKELQIFMQQQLLHGIPAQERTWLEGALRELFAIEEPHEKTLLADFTTTIYLGIIGFIFKNAKTLPEQNPDEIHGNLVLLFGPIANDAHNLFMILNSKERAQTVRQKLTISEADTRAYIKAIGKPEETRVSELNTQELAYWVAARKAIDRLFTDEQWLEALPEFLRQIFTKETAATFAMRAYETVHQTQRELEQEEQVGLEEASKEKGLIQFIDEYIYETVIEHLHELGSSEGVVHTSLPTLLDSLLKEIYRDTTTDMSKIRNIIARRIIYTIVGKLLTDSTPLLDNALRLVQSYNGLDDQKTASLVVETMLPQELTKTPLAKLIISQVVKVELVEYIQDIRSCQERILHNGKEAKSYLESLDGVKPFLIDVIQDLDSTLDSLARNKDVKLSDDFPDYVDNLLKEALLDEELQPIIRSFFHNVVYIILQNAATPKRGQTVQGRFVEVLQELAQDYAEDSSGLTLLKKLLPDETLQEILPDFMHKFVTHEKLLQWFFKPYIQQLEATKQQVLDENIKAPNQNAQDAQKFVKGYLLDQPTKGGLLQYKGTVREVERGILDMLKDNSFVTEYHNAIVSKITHSLEDQGYLSPNFVSDALFNALDDASPLPDDSEFSAHVLQLVFPQGAKDLPVPAVAQNFIWQKLSNTLTRLFTELTTRDLRKLLILDHLIPQTSTNKALVSQRLQVIEDLRNECKANNKPHDFDSRCEAMFTLYTREAAIKKTQDRIQSYHLPSPIKWLVSKVATFVTYLSVRLSLAKRLHTFIDDPQTDDKFRRALWSFVRFKPQVVHVTKGELKQKIDQNLNRLAPPSMQNFLAGHIADFIFNRNLLQILAN